VDNQEKVYMNTAEEIRGLAVKARAAAALMRSEGLTAEDIEDLRKEFGL
jgi:hypothetical protein